MIFIFNPETDYALASAGDSYTAPKGVTALRLRLTPEIARTLSPGDFLMLYDSEECEFCRQSAWGKECESKGVKLITPSEVADIAIFSKITVWGWNLAIRNLLVRNHVAERFIPTIEDIANIRRLAHRRTTITFNRRLNELLATNIPLPEEYTSAEDAISRVECDRNCFIKAPWSSSGRGVNHASSLRAGKLEARIRSIISKQGSVMIEQAAEKKFDFATEWYLSEGVAAYAGISVFHTAPDGEYVNNKIASQTTLNEMIKKLAPSWGEDIINAQKKVLEEIIAPYYSGPAGIDMLADMEGKIWHCIEINLRHTMGHLALLQACNDVTTSLEVRERNL